MAILCSSKTQAEFTPHQLATWSDALSIYETTTANEAILSLAVDTDPFPDLAKVLQKCELIRRRKAGTSSSTANVQPPLHKLAKAWGIEI